MALVMNAYIPPAESAETFACLCNGVNRFLSTCPQMLPSFLFSLTCELKGILGKDTWKISPRRKSIGRTFSYQICLCSQRFAPRHDWDKELSQAKVGTVAEQWKSLTLCEKRQSLRWRLGDEESLLMELSDWRMVWLFYHSLVTFLFVLVEQCSCSQDTKAFRGPDLCSATKCRTKMATGLWLMWPYGRMAVPISE